MHYYTFSSIQVFQFQGPTALNSGTCTWNGAIMNVISLTCVWQVKMPTLKVYNMLKGNFLHNVGSTCKLTMVNFPHCCLRAQSPSRCPTTVHQVTQFTQSSRLFLLLLFELLIVLLQFCISASPQTKGSKSWIKRAQLQLPSSLIITNYLIISYYFCVFSFKGKT